MSSDVFHSLAIDIDLATILQAFQILFPGERTLVLARKSSGFMSLYSINRNTIVNLCVVFVIQLKLAGAITGRDFWDNGWYFSGRVRFCDRGRF